MIKLNSKKGFTLIELMIVVVIIGILAALAIPRYMQTANTTKQAEAKQILHQVFTLEQVYHNEFTTYWAGGPGSAAAPNALATLGVEIAPSAIYSYVIVAGAAGIATTFTVTATANLDDDATIDTWTMDEQGLLQNTINDVIT